MAGTRTRTYFRLLAAGLALATLAACTRTDEVADDGDSAVPVERIDGGQIVFGAEQEPSGFNYASSKDSIIAVRDVIENIFFFAVKSGPDGTLHYEGLASEPTLVSEEPQVVEWTISPDATWSDGTPVTTQDIQYHFDSVTNPDLPVATRVGYERIQTLELVDDKTFRATFASPYGDFRGLWQAMPQAAYLAAQPAGWENGLNESPGPSAGPYMFESWEKGVSITLVPNPEWKGEPAPTLDRLVLRFLPETSTLPDALRNQEVDVILAQAQTDLLQDLEGVPGLTTEVVLGPAFEHLVLNVKDPVVGDPAVRRAIAYGVNRDALVEGLVKPFHPEAEPLDNMVLTNIESPSYEAHGDEYQEQDITAAQQVLEEAGWTEGPDGVRSKDGQPLTIEFATTSGNERREQALELIKSQLAEVGIEVTIDTCPAACLFSDRLPVGDFQVALKSWSGSPFPIADATARFTTGGGDNYGAYSNPSVDELAAQAGAALEESEQAELGNALDETLWEDLTMIPLYSLPDLAGYRTSLVGLEPNGTRDGMLWNAAGWGLSQ